MIINWYGEGCFKIQTGGLTLLTDPFESNIGLTPARGKNEVVIKTLTPWPMPKSDTEESGQIISGGGEYEIQGISIQGFPLQKESSGNLPAGRQEFFKTVYKVTAEEITLGFLGHLSDELTPEALQSLKDSHIIFMPAGGKPFLNPEKSAKLLKQLNPKIVVASFFKVPGLKRQSSDWKSLVDELGQKPEILEKLVTKRRELQEQKGMRLVVLKI